MKLSVVACDVPCHNNLLASVIISARHMEENFKCIVICIISLKINDIELYH